MTVLIRLIAAFLMFSHGFVLAAPVNDAQTRYPIVLVHGLFGYNSLDGVDYFYQIPADLRKSGAQVFVTQVSAANSTEVRGEQLLLQVKNILAITGATKVNLIGHSHGAPTARYVAGVSPNLIASVTSVAGANQGSAVADIVLRLAPPGSLSEAILSKIATAYADLVGGSALPNQPVNALNSLTTTGAVTFNKKFPQGLPTSACQMGSQQVNGIRYYSWSGASTITNLLDIKSLPFGVLGPLAFGSKASDGLLEKCSTNLGMVIRNNYDMNHMNVVNQNFGLVSLFEVNPKTLYREHAKRLKNIGL
ncbi:triacylglycerol lipase [Neisseriaceae bacterium TC5R-5]|nr:triacylglycerol lipase [Neisseriaceae bacterium TC5R-5]